MRVDETGDDVLAGRIVGVGRLLLDMRSDADDGIAHDAHVGGHCRGARSIHHKAVLDYEIVHVIAFQSSDSIANCQPRYPSLAATRDPWG